MALTIGYATFVKGWEGRGTRDTLLGGTVGGGGYLTNLISYRVS